MASTSGIRTGRHVDNRQKEQSEMSNHASGIGNMARIALIGIALSLATSQAAGADSLRPTVDAGGPGGGTSSAEVYYELEREQGRPVVIEQADSQSAELAAYQRSQVWPNFNLGNTVAQQPNNSASGGGSYVIVDDRGNASVPEWVAAPSPQGNIMTCPPCAMQA